jgi:hypothetical protein
LQQLTPAITAQQQLTSATLCSDQYKRHPPHLRLLRRKAQVQDAVEAHLLLELAHQGLRSRDVRAGSR